MAGSTAERGCLRCGERAGYEIGRAGLAFAFDSLQADRVVAFTEAHNLRSRAVMDRLGMIHVQNLEMPGLVPGSEGVHPNARFVLYEMLRNRLLG